MRSAAAPSAAVFFGPNGTGPWHTEEIHVLLDKAARTREDFRVIPVNEEKYYFADYIGEAQWSAKGLFGHSRGRSPTTSIYLAPGNDSKIVFQL